jgi:hypothetical protein
VTDADDKTGRHSWANKISLTTLLVIVFGIGGAFVEARFTRRAVDDLAGSLKEAVREQKQFNAAIDARQTTDEIWRAAHEAAREERTSERKQRR